MTPHADPPPTTSRDVAIEWAISFRHFAVTAGLVACVWMMTKCSEKWIDKEAKSAEVQG